MFVVSFLWLTKEWAEMGESRQKINGARWPRVSETILQPCPGRCSQSGACTSAARTGRFSNGDDDRPHAGSARARRKQRVSVKGARAFIKFLSFLAFSLCLSLACLVAPLGCFCLPRPGCCFCRGPREICGKGRAVKVTGKNRDWGGKEDVPGD